ncbi:MAG: EamA family transporter [Clostridiales Family XIII bacterium]|jgi:drug/metabolite transporter (DMT)-like permease|nr:EamA family transporter [Clostridiales Family XIII bacterium]
MMRLKADLSLLLVTLGWGVSYILIDICLSELPPFTLNAWRFLGAFFVAFLLSSKRLIRIGRDTLKYSAYIGVALLFVYSGATFGVMYTSLSNAGFLCGLTVIFTPLLGLLVFRKRPDAKLVAAVVMALAGIGLLTLKDDLRFASGDVFCIMAALSYAVDLLVTERAVKKPSVDAFGLGVYQLGFTGLFMLIAALIFETPHPPVYPGTWGALIFLTVFCTGIAFIVQAVAQQYTDASRVGVIFTLEPVFAGVAARVFAGEVLSGRATLGAVLLLCSLFFIEIDFRKLRSALKKVRRRGSLDK